MQAPVISVIIPVYNAAASLTSSLDSLLAQTYPSWEAICINDGSQDNSQQVLQDYASRDSRIIIINQENAGVSTARNNGMAVAQGEYITFVDADDELTPCFLQEFADEVAHSHADMIVCGIVMKYTDEDKEMEIIPKNGEHDLSGCLSINALALSQMQPFACAKLLKNDIIRNHGLKLKRELTIGEDTTFHYQYMLHAESIAFIPHANYIYWQRGESAWHRFKRGKAPLHTYYDFFKIVTIPMQELGHREVDNNEAWWQEMNRQSHRLTNILMGCHLSRICKIALYLYGFLLCLHCSTHTKSYSFFSVLRTGLKRLLRIILCG